MNCSEFEATLHQLVESHDQQHLHEALNHRDGCRACESLWRDYCLLESAIAAWRPVTVPTTLSDRVLQSLTGRSSRSMAPVALPSLPSHLNRPTIEQAHHSPRRQHRSSWAVAAIVACLAMTCWVATHSSNPLRDPAEPIARTPPFDERDQTRERMAAVTEVEVSESVVAVLADLKAEYQELANETAAAARDFASVIPQSVAWPGTVSPARDSLPANEGADTAVQPGVELGRSIGDQIGQAIGFLWETVPGRVPSG